MRNRLRRPWFAAVCAVLGFHASSSLAATTVVVERLADGSVRVDYELDAAATELVLADVPGPRGVDWRADWTVLSDTLTLQDKRIASTTRSPFSAASVRIEPAERTALTMLATMGARSSVVDLRFLVPQPPAAEVCSKMRNAFDVRARACVDELHLEGAGAPRPSGGASWLVVVSTSRDACREAIRDGDLTFLVEGAPAQLQAIAAEQFASAYRRLSEKLGRPLDPPPALILAHKGRSGGGVWASAGASTPSFSLRSKGIAGLRRTHAVRAVWGPASRGRSRLDWLAGVDESPPRAFARRALARGRRRTTYLAVLDSQSLGEEVYPEPAGRMLLADIELCSRQSKDRPFLGAVAVPVERVAEVRAADPIRLRRDHAGRDAGERTIFDAWADVLADADGGPIEAGSFLATNERARAAVAGLVYGPAADFEGIVTALRNAGIDASLGDPRDTGGAVAPSLDAFVRNDCSEGLRGATFMDDRVKITTRGTCRTLPQDNELIRIEGVGILTSAPEVTAPWRRRAPARARAPDRRSSDAGVRADCPASLPELPRQLFIRNVHFLN